MMMIRGAHERVAHQAGASESRRGAFQDCGSFVSRGRLVLVAGPAAEDPYLRGIRQRTKSTWKLMDGKKMEATIKGFDLV